MKYGKGGVAAVIGAVLGFRRVAAEDTLDAAISEGDGEAVVISDASGGNSNQAATREAHRNHHHHNNNNNHGHHGGNNNGGFDS